MKHDIKTGKAETLDYDCLVVGVFSKAKMPDNTKRLDKICDSRIRKLLKSGDHDGEVGSAITLYDVPDVKASRIMIVGLGAENKLNDRQFKKAVHNVVKSLSRSGCKSALLLLPDVDYDDSTVGARVRLAAQASGVAMYRYDATKSKKKPSVSLSRVDLHVSNSRSAQAAKKMLQQGQATANGVNLARELGNLPANVCTPTYLSEQAKKMRSSHGLKVTIYDEARMEKLKMRTLLSVSRGSREPAQLIVMEYSGGRKKAAPVALVGKGITFDTGGISLKPGGKMDEMKFDMCGAASVFGTMCAIAEMKLPLNVVAVVAASENMPDGLATKPGDIIESMSGQTVEILNTDAEGRLVLCDALTFTKRFKPSAVVDIATLTGACVIALGAHASGLFSNDQALADELLSAGERSGDRAWQMPLWDEYQRQLKSNFADLANIGGREAGSVTAACFLSKFAEEMSWAHLDIAGTAWFGGGSKGSSGRPVPLLTNFLMKRAGVK